MLRLVSNPILIVILKMMKSPTNPEVSLGTRKSTRKAKP